MSLSDSTQPEGGGGGAWGDFGGMPGPGPGTSPNSFQVLVSPNIFFFLKTSFVLICVALQGLTAKTAA